MAKRRHKKKLGSTNLHHLVPRSRGGQGGDNVIAIDQRWHAALHMAFGCLTPREYLLVASKSPDYYARRWVRAIVHFFGTDALSEIDPD